MEQLKSDDQRRDSRPGVIRGRRAFLLRISATGVLLQLRSLIAQERSPEIVAAVQTNRTSAEALLKEVAGAAAEMNDDYAGSLAARETALRSSLRRTLASIPTAELPLYVAPDRKGLADTFEKEDVPLLPEEGEIKAQVVPRKEQPEGCKESMPSVVVDIFLESLGLQEVKEAIKEVVAKSPEIQSKIDALAKALQLKDWSQALDLVGVILDLMSGASKANEFVKVLGGERGRRAWKLLLAKLGARFVPFVGQVYTAATVGVALFNNRGRVLEAIKCASQ